MRRAAYAILVLLLCLPLLLPACGASRTSLPVTPGIVPLEGVHLDRDASQPYLARVSFSPREAQYFDLVNKAMSLSQAEIERLAQDGFVVSGRLAWQRFLEAYAWIYWQDLPVLVTTDSILHAVHQSYDDLLKDLERSILIPRLERLLGDSQAQVAAGQAANADGRLDALYQDVATYLAVAQALLNGEAGESAAAKQLVAWAVAADAVAEIDLFGSKRPIDFTLFLPRGHYAESEELQRYFRAMAWLAQADFRFVEFDPLTGAPTLHLEQIAAAAILRDALAASGGRETWAQINGLVELLVGPSDNMTLPDLDRFLADAGLAGPAGILRADAGAILALLTQNDYGQQRITGQLLYRHIANDSAEPIPRPVSFMLLGQRFAIDSYVMSNLVYDSLMVDGRPVERALPSPLDVMAALGNDRAVTHLAGELKTYGYEGHLAALRRQVDGLPPSFWTAPVYNQWLRLIRALNAPTTAGTYPQAMRTAAWADKMLHTQLASWAQLRHDNILYVKQSFTAMAVCEYPSGYVEPYPEFYAALYELADADRGILAQLDLDGLERQRRGGSRQGGRLFRADHTHRRAPGGDGRQGAAARAVQRRGGGVPEGDRRPRECGKDVWGTYRALEWLVRGPVLRRGRQSGADRRRPYQPQQRPLQRPLSATRAARSHRSGRAHLPDRGYRRRPDPVRRPRLHLLRSDRGRLPTRPPDRRGLARAVGRRSLPGCPGMDHRLPPVARWAAGLAPVADWGGIGKRPSVCSPIPRP